VHVERIAQQVGVPRLKKARDPGVSPRSLVPTQVVPCLERRSVTSSESASW
jgi:hypothetical protein